MSDLKEALLKKRESIEDAFKERRGGRWSDADRVVSEALFSDPMSDLFLEATAGEKSRLGICVLAVLAWESSRVHMLEPVERSLVATNAAIFSFKNVLESFRSDLNSIKETLGSKESSSPAAAIDLTPVLDEVKALRDIELLREERISAQKSERLKREAADKAAKEAKLAALELKKKSVAEDKLAKKALKKAARAKKAERKKALSEGKNPYSPEEEALFRASIEKKGKKFYSYAERANYKGKSVPEKPVPAKSFVRYSAKQKADWIYKNFTSKGKTYYSPEDRRLFKLKISGLPAASPKSGQTTPRAGSPALASA